MAKRSVAAGAVVAAVVAAWGVAGPPAAAAADDDVAAAQEAVFGRRHLDNIVEAPVTLHYDYRRGGTLLPEVADDADLAITAIGPDRRKEVAFDLFSGPNARRFEPPQGYRSNPLIVVFLQRDVEQMGRMTGGSPQYFRQRIREAFADPGAVRAEPVTVPVGGRELAGTKVTVEPFVRDPNALRFPDFRRKRYEFVLAPEVPGGVYSLRAVTPPPEPGGEPLLDESMTYGGAGAAEPGGPREEPGEGRDR